MRLSFIFCRFLWCLKITVLIAMKSRIFLQKRNNTYVYLAKRSSKTKGILAQGYFQTTWHFGRCQMIKTELICFKLLNSSACKICFVFQTPLNWYWSKQILTQCGNLRHFPPMLSSLRCHQITSRNSLNFSTLYSHLSMLIT